MHADEWDALAEGLLGETAARDGANVAASESEQVMRPASMDAGEWAAMTDELLGDDGELVDEMLRDHELGTAASLPRISEQPRSRPKRSRPAGTFGGRALREQIQEMAAQEPEAEAQLVPGSAAYARAAKEQKRLRRAASVDQPLADAPAGNGAALAGMGLGAWALLDKLPCNEAQQLFAVVQARPLRLPQQSEQQQTTHDAFLSEFLQPGPKHLTGVTALADKRHVARSWATSVMRSAGGAALESGKVLWGTCFAALRKNLESGSWKPLLFCSQCRYDETPTLVRVAKKLLGQAGAEQTPAESDKSHHSKVVQGEGSFHIVVSDEQQRFFHICGVVPNLLQMVQSTTAENLKQARVNLLHLDGIPGLSDVQRHFGWVLQAATVDRYAANLKAEKSLLHDVLDGEENGCEEDAAPQFSKLTLPCDVHKAHQATTAALGLVAADVSGLVSTSLSQHGLGTVHKLRTILCSLFDQRLKIYKDTSPPAASSRYRQAVHDLYLPVTPDPMVAGDPDCHKQHCHHQNGRRRFACLNTLQKVVS